MTAPPTTEPNEPSPWAVLAHVRRPQGRKGEVFADILTDFPEKFAERRRLWLVRDGTSAPSNPGAPDPGSPRTGLRSRGGDPSHFGTWETGSTNLKPPLELPFEVHLTNHWLHKGGIVLHFEGVDSISAAESLKGLYIAIPRAERAPLAEGEAYIDDLVGCLLVDVAQPEPRVVGPIEDVDRTAGPVALLVVRGPHGEILVPFAKDYLCRIDLESRRVEMALPEGLLDLNAAES
ncbi:MAG: ribosome maturation factor RimM [Terracidiphilus sp.]